MDDMIKREQYETERLCIRHFDPVNVDSCYKGWGQDEHLGKFILGYPMTEETMKSFVMTMVENAWVIVEKKSGQCIGYITVDIPYPQLAIGEIGYVIGEHFQRTSIWKRICSYHLRRVRLLQQMQQHFQGSFYRWRMVLFIPMIAMRLKSMIRSWMPWRI